VADRIDSREAWLTTVAALVIASIALGAPWIVIVALKPVAADFGGYRSIPSAAASLAMIGTGFGGLLMGWVADRVGVRYVVMFGATMVCAGLLLSSTGRAWGLYVGHGLLIGLIGNGAIHAPLLVYVTRWFERRRGTAGPDRERAIRRRRLLATAVRARRRRIRVATNDDRLRLPRGVGSRAARLAVAEACARVSPIRQPSRIGRSYGASIRSEAQHGFRAARRRGVPLLCADGHAVSASDRSVW
jgi:hypothetical protein